MEIFKMFGGLLKSGEVSGSTFIEKPTHIVKKLQYDYENMVFHVEQTLWNGVDNEQLIHLISKDQIKMVQFRGGNTNFITDDRTYILKNGLNRDVFRELYSSNYKTIEHIEKEDEFEVVQNDKGGLTIRAKESSTNEEV